MVGRVRSSTKGKLVSTQAQSLTGDSLRGLYFAKKQVQILCIPIPGAPPGPHRSGCEPNARNSDKTMTMTTMKAIAAAALIGLGCADAVGSRQRRVAAMAMAATAATLGARAYSASASAPWSAARSRRARSMWRRRRRLPITARRPTGLRHGAPPGTAIAATCTAPISIRTRATSRRLTAAGISAARLPGDDHLPTIRAGSSPAGPDLFSRKSFAARNARLGATPRAQPSINLRIFDALFTPAATRLAGSRPLCLEWGSRHSAKSARSGMSPNESAGRPASGPERRRILG